MDNFMQDYGIIAWIVIGLLAGGIAKLLMPGNDPGGFIVTILLGIAGAVVGGVLSGWVSRVEAQGRAVVACILVWGLAMTGFGLAVGAADRTSFNSRDSPSDRSQTRVCPPS